MNISNVEINWWLGYINTPEFVVTVDAIPKNLEYTYKEGMYWAHKNGYVDFLYYQSPGEGFGGRTFNLNMKDGSKVSLKGPWSSSASVANKMGFIPCSEVTIVEKYRYRGYLTVPRLLECADEMHVFLLMRIDRGNKYIRVTDRNWKDLAIQYKGVEFSYLPSLSPTEALRPCTK